MAVRARGIPPCALRRADVGPGSALSRHIAAVSTYGGGARSWPPPEPPRGGKIERLGEILDRVFARLLEQRAMPLADGKTQGDEVRPWHTPMSEAAPAPGEASCMTATEAACRQ